MSLKTRLLAAVFHVAGLMINFATIPPACAQAPVPAFATNDATAR